MEVLISIFLYKFGINRIIREKLGCRKFAITASNNDKTYIVKQGNLKMIIPVNVRHKSPKRVGCKFRSNGVSFPK